MDNNIRILRAKNDITQDKLAEKVGASRQTISAIERGRYNPSIELAFKIAEYFDCDVEDIFFPDVSISE